MEENIKGITVALNVKLSFKNSDLNRIHLLRLTFHQYLRVVSCLVTLEILVNRCSIHQKPSSFTHSLQIYCIGLILQLFWTWATNGDPTGSVPIVSEPMSVTWIQISFPTCKEKKKDGSLYEGKKKLKKLI